MYKGQTQDKMIDPTFDPYLSTKHSDFRFGYRNFNT